MRQVVRRGWATSIGRRSLERLFIEVPHAILRSPRVDNNAFVRTPLADFRFAPCGRYTAPHQRFPPRLRRSGAVQLPNVVRAARSHVTVMHSANPSPGHHTMRAAITTILAVAGVWFIAISLIAPPSFQDDPGPTIKIDSLANRWAAISPRDEWSSIDISANPGALFSPAESCESDFPDGRCLVGWLSCSPGVLFCTFEHRSEGRGLTVKRRSDGVPISGLVRILGCVLLLGAWRTGRRPAINHAAASPPDDTHPKDPRRQVWQ